MLLPDSTAPFHEVKTVGIKEQDGVFQITQAGVYQISWYADAYDGGIPTFMNLKVGWMPHWQESPSGQLVATLSPGKPVELKSIRLTNVKAGYYLMVVRLSP